MGKILSSLKHVLYMDIITWIAHTDASLPLMANSLEHIWYYSRTCFSHAFY